MLNETWPNGCGLLDIALLLQHLAKGSVNAQVLSVWTAATK
jgi:hypothetical protein